MAYTHLSSNHVKPQGMEWSPTKFPGVSIKLLHEEKSTGLFTALFKWDPGATLPFHEHAELEQTFILTGKLVDEEGEVGPGEYVSRPSGSRHIAVAPVGCLHISFFLKPNIFITADGAATPFSTGSEV